MLKLIRSNNTINYLLAFIAMLALWAYKFVEMPTAVDTGGVHSYFFMLSYESSLFQYIFTSFVFAISFVFACYLSKANFKYQMVESGYQSPTVFFTLLTGSVINAQRCIPEMFASIFISLAILRIFSMYNKRDEIRGCLDVGLLYGISLLFAYKYVVLLPALLLVMAIVKPLSWRDVVSFLISMVFSIGIAFCLVWLYGNMNELLENVRIEAQRLVIGEKYDMLNLYFNFPVIFSVLISFLSMFIVRMSRKTSEVKYSHAMLFLLVYYGVFLASPLSSNESVWIMYFPLCYLLSNILVNAKKRYVQAIIFYGLIISLVVSQMIQIFYYNSIF